MSYFPELMAQLDADIRAAWSIPSTAPVWFGAPAAPDRVYPCAVVRAQVERENVGRHVVETWTFEIEGKFEKPTGEMLDAFLIARGYDLADRLAPWDKETVPAAPAAYAGIAGRPRVTSIVPLDLDGGDSHAGVRLTFSCETVVYQ